MTVRLSPDAPRRKSAERFGVVLREAMAKHRIGQIPLAKQTGCAPSAVASWRNGHNLPRLETAMRLAAALGDDRLTSIVRDARSADCETCGRPFLNEGGSPKRYCEPACAKVAAALRSGRPTRERAILAERHLRRYRAAVDAYCGECEPEGLCRDVDCLLRPVSPLPLARFEAPRVLTVVPPPGMQHDDEWRERMRAANAERWARPGERERASERTRAMWRERRDELGAAISRGRRASR